MNTDKMIPLKKFAESNQIGYRTAYRHWQNGLLEGIKLPTGTILVKGWKESDVQTEGKTKKCIIFIRKVQQNNNIVEKIEILKQIALDNNLIVQDIIVWNAYSFEENPFLKEIIDSGVKNIITTSYSDIYGSNYNVIEYLFQQLQINTIAIEEPKKIDNSIKGLIASSSKMAKAAVGMHSFKKDISHYISNILN